MKKRCLSIIMAAAVFFATVTPASVYASTESGTISDILVSVFAESAAAESAAASRPEASAPAESAGESQQASEQTAPAESAPAESAAGDDGSTPDEQAQESLASSESTPAESTPEAPVERTITAELSEDTKTIAVNVQGTDPSATEVNIAVWSRTKGQDDLTWTPAELAEDGNYTASVPVEGHEHTGLYEVQCCEVLNGETVTTAGTRVYVPEPQGRVFAENMDKTDGTFKVRVTDLDVPSGVKEVRLPVWSVEDGRDDLTWYKAKKDGDDYVVDISTADHNFDTGKYVVHAYVRDGNGILSVLRKGTTFITYESGVSTRIDDEQMNVELDLRGYNDSEDLKAAVWSDADGQDDVLWYGLTTVGKGAIVSVPVSDHAVSGKYEAHIYSGEETLVGTEFEIDALTAETLEVSDVNGTNGTFRVSLSDIESISGVSKVEFSVWPTGTEGNRKTYTASENEGVYSAGIDVVNHGRAFGNYTIRAYAYGNNGVRDLVQETTCDIKAQNYSYIESTGAYTARLWMVNPDASNVRFAVWSQANGQDDLVWYNGSQNGASWFAEVNSENHSVGGTYIADCYVTAGGSETIAKQLSFNVDKKAPPANPGRITIEAGNPEMDALAQGIASRTQYLILINRGLHRVSIYQGGQGSWTNIKYWPCVVGAPATPTPTGEYEIKGRFSWFGDGHKCWWATQIEGYYYFHSQSYLWDDTPVTVLDPAMDCAVSHGCVRLYLENAKWIWDTIPRGTKVYIYN